MQYKKTKYEIFLQQDFTKSLTKICYNKSRSYKLMEEVKKLELMIKNNSRYEDTIGQSMQIDKYIEKKIEEAIVLPHIWFISQLVFE